MKFKKRNSLSPSLRRCSVDRSKFKEDNSKSRRLKYRDIDYAVANNEIPAKTQELPKILKQELHLIITGVLQVIKMSFSRTTVGSDLRKRTKCLMGCEAATVLQGIEEQLLILSKDPTIKLPGAFNQGLDYAKAITAIQILNLMLRPHNISEEEIYMIANVYPETADEAFALLPSLKVVELVEDHLSSEGLMWSDPRGSTKPL